MSLAKSLILGLMILAVLKGTVSVISQHVTKAFKESSMCLCKPLLSKPSMEPVTEQSIGSDPSTHAQDSYRVQTRTELFDHLLAQDLASQINPSACVSVAGNGVSLAIVCLSHPS